MPCIFHPAHTRRSPTPPTLLNQQAVPPLAHRAPSIDTLPNVPAEAPETQQQSLYYPLELVRFSPVEAHPHIHRQRHIQHRCAQVERTITPLPPAAHVQFRGEVMKPSSAGGELQSVPPHRPRVPALAHPADTSRSNLAAALGLLSRRLSNSKPRRAHRRPRRSCWAT
jgi:hypothetical protein